jgi:hypothetical protein
MLLAQINMESITDGMKAQLPFSFLHIVVAAALIYFFRNQIADAFARIHKRNEPAVAPSPEAVAQVAPKPVARTVPGVELVHKTLIAAGIDPKEASEFIKKNYDVITANAAGKRGE